jgi:hypothetical protein
MVKGKRSSLLGISLSQSESVSTHSPQMVSSPLRSGCYGNVPVKSPEIINTFPAAGPSIDIMDPETNFL